MKKLFKITQIKPRIFLVSLSNSYDLAMTFLRYQEHYESPSSKFRGKSFTILDFMEWYSKEFGEGCFTYAEDWGGFNFPSSNYLEIEQLGIIDYNKYDKIMSDIYQECRDKINKKDNDIIPFYIIGAKSNETAVIKHEVAHGFFYTIPKYKKEMTKLVKELNPKFRKSLCAYLKKIGYAPKVYIDECQAYLSTGLPDGFEVEGINECKPFIKLYNKYYKETNVA